jgi:hypothetical protein
MFLPVLTFDNLFFEKTKEKLQVQNLGIVEGTLVCKKSLSLPPLLLHPTLGKVEHLHEL